MRVPCLASALIAAATPAVAADVLIEVRTAAGQPVPHAVLTLYPGGRPTPPARGGAYRVEQRDLQFSPFVLVVPPGSDVSFPNFDNVRHHVYSFSPVRRFELQLFAREQTRSVRFDRPGIVPLGCNIHDGMIAYIHVVDTGLAVRTDAQGRAMLTNVPVGPAVARLWHPYLRAPNNQVQGNWTIQAGRQGQVITVNLRPPPRPPRTY
ncbi:methylamine utilization protein [Sphingosinicella sp.]|uniref:methylamine utilization protein n=1 Tax=Sphingosinicella sp. TaxID=1917971 RepID=UPI00403823C9